MARFNVVDEGALGGLIDDINRLSEDIRGPAIDAALTEGGEVLSEYFKGAILIHGLVDTGQLHKSIKPTPVKSDKRGKHLDVYPQGTRERAGKQKKAISNAEVGFVQEYGVTRVPPKKSTPATHWMSNTVDDVGEEILDIMEQNINEIIDKHLL